MPRLHHRCWVCQGQIEVTNRVLSELFLPVEHKGKDWDNEMVNDRRRKRKREEEEQNHERENTNREVAIIQQM